AKPSFWCVCLYPVRISGECSTCLAFTCLACGEVIARLVCTCRTGAKSDFALGSSAAFDLIAAGQARTSGARVAGCDVDSASCAVVPAAICEVAAAVLVSLLTRTRSGAQETDIPVIIASTITPGTAGFQFWVLPLRFGSRIRPTRTDNCRIRLTAAGASAICRRIKL